MGMTLKRGLFRVKKLDGRHTAYPHFSHYIEENLWRSARTTWAKGMQASDYQDYNFFTLREWFWTQLGPSKEFRYWQAHGAPNVTPANRSNNDQWCWDTEFGKQRFYVTPIALTYFNLQWM
jgi:hypothetical protein